MKQFYTIFIFCTIFLGILAGQVLEAEHAEISGDILIQDDPDASNAAFVYLRNSGEISWADIQVAEAGFYSISIRYRLMINDRYQTLWVNGEEWGSIHFQGEAMIWLDKEVEVELTAGNNTITLVSDWGWQHFDYISQPVQAGIPFANFTYLPVSPGLNENIQFDAGASSDDLGIVDYSWDFGDGAFASGVLTSHSYTDYGNYPVTLVVTDGDNNTATATQYVEIVSIEMSIRINEIMSDNATTITSDMDEYPDWIELFNTGNSTVDLGGWYLSDDPDTPEKWQIPDGSDIASGELGLFWADGLDVGMHTNFKLSSSGEFLSLANPDGEIVDSIDFPALLMDISFGRNPGFIQQWVFYSNTTPGLENGSVYYQGICTEPLRSIDGGFYTGPQELQLESELENAEIRYTMDGTPVDQSSELYSEPIQLTETIPIRMKVFKPGYLPSKTVTQTYFIDETVNLPHVSLVTNPDNFFDDEIGIYVIGTNGVSGYCSSIPMNLNQDWERPVNIEFFETDGQVGLNQEAGVKIFGGCSRTRYPQKSLGFYARAIYGDGSFSYQLFPDKPIESFETFILRSSADDQVTTMFRDALAQSVVADVIDIDGQAYRPVVVYINGEYWGIHNLREKINEHYPAGNYNLDADDVDILKRNAWDDYNIVSGSADHYRDMLNYIDSHNMSSDDAYQYIRTQMDVDEFINYQITEIYLAADDWPGNNIKYWRSSTEPHTTWRWITYDMDWTFTYPEKNELAIATEIDCGCSWPNPPWSTYLFRKLLENSDFTSSFLQLQALYEQTVFHPERLIHFIDSLQAQIAPEIPGHIDRWGGQLVPDPESWISPTFATVEEWEENVEVMRTFANTRAPYANQHLISYFGLNGMASLTMNLDDPDAGSLTILDRAVNDGFSADFFRDIPLHVSVQPNPGFEFDHWQVSGTILSSVELIPQGALWSYRDTGEILGTDWTDPGYDDSFWSTGNAELGYGDGDETTIVEYGPDSNNKFVTTYFRHSFDIENPDEIQELVLQILRDDGAVMYLNGTEIDRSNMPQGPIYYNTYASDYASGQEETTFYSYSVNPDLLFQGENLLAVEIHQSSGGSSDISFDLILSGSTQSSGNEELVLDEELSLIMTGDLELTAFFSGNPIPDGQSVVINEINYKSAPEHDTEDWVELTNISAHVIDLTGWEFKDSNDQHVYTIPNGVLLQPEQYLVLCRDISAFSDYHPGVSNIAGDFDFGLSSDGELIRLYDETGVLQDEVTYSNSAPWPTEPDGEGATLELINPLLDGALSENWQASMGYGTPGSVNSQYNAVLPGDLNLSGDVDIVDIVLLVSIIVEPLVPDAYQLLSGDLVQDGQLDILDVVAIVALIIGV